MIKLKTKLDFTAGLILAFFLSILFIQWKSQNCFLHEQVSWKWKTVSILLQMKDRLNSFANRRHPHYFENGRQHYFFVNGRWPMFFVVNIYAINIFFQILLSSLNLSNRPNASVYKRKVVIKFSKLKERQVPPVYWYRQCLEQNCQTETDSVIVEHSHVDVILPVNSLSVIKPQGLYK